MQTRILRCHSKTGRGSTLHQAESLHLVAVSFEVNAKAEGHNLCNRLQPKNAGQRGINDVQHLQQGQIIESHDLSKLFEMFVSEICTACGSQVLLLVVCKSMSDVYITWQAATA